MYGLLFRPWVLFILLQNRYHSVLLATEHLFAVGMRNALQITPNKFHSQCVSIDYGSVSRDGGIVGRLVLGTGGHVISLVTWLSRPC